MTRTDPQLHLMVQRAIAGTQAGTQAGASKITAQTRSREATGGARVSLWITVLLQELPKGLHGRYQGVTSEIPYTPTQWPKFFPPGSLPKGSTTFQKCHPGDQTFNHDGPLGGTLKPFPKHSKHVVWVGDVWDLYLCMTPTSWHIFWDAFSNHWSSFSFCITQGVWLECSSNKDLWAPYFPLIKNQRKYIKRSK
jgi:hypothetical protein